MANTRPAPRQIRSGGSATKRRPPGGALQAGTAAPDFELNSTPDQTVRLSDFRGRPVILAFYPADWSPVCGDELALFNELLPEFSKHNAQLMGISVDGVWCDAAYARDRKLHFPLLADYEPKGAISKTFGVYNAREGHSDRALFLIDRDGIIRWSYVSPEGVNPGANGVLRALDALDAKETTHA
jgi:peroxiredoxin